MTVPATAEWQLAEMNIMRLRSPLDHPSLRPVRAAIDQVNIVAEASPGFVWRLAAGPGHFHSLGSDPLTMATLSVWRSYEDLHRFTYRSAHVARLLHKAPTGLV